MVEFSSGIPSVRKTWSYFGLWRRAARMVRGLEYSSARKAGRVGLIYSGEEKDSGRPYDAPMRKAYKKGPFIRESSNRRG